MCLARNELAYLQELSDELLRRYKDRADLDITDLAHRGHKFEPGSEGRKRASGSYKAHRRLYEKGDRVSKFRNYSGARTEREKRAAKGRVAPTDSYGFKGSLYRKADLDR